MATSRTLLLKTNIIPDLGLVSIIVTAVGVLGALVMWWARQATWANFLFDRPDTFWIAPKRRAVQLQAAE